MNSGGTVYLGSGGNISNITYSGGMQIIDNITSGYDNMTLGSGGTNVTMGIISGAQMSGTIMTLFFNIFSNNLMCCCTTSMATIHFLIFKLNIYNIFNYFF